MNLEKKSYFDNLDVFKHEISELVTGFKLFFTSPEQKFNWGTYCKCALFSKIVINGAIRLLLPILPLLLLLWGAIYIYDKQLEPFSHIFTLQGASIEL